MEQTYNSNVNIILVYSAPSLGITCVRSAKTVRLKFQLNRVIGRLTEVKLVLDRVAKFVRNHELWAVHPYFEEAVEKRGLIRDAVIWRAIRCIISVCRTASCNNRI